jgi:hypothetical protein
VVCKKTGVEGTDALLQFIVTDNENTARFEFIPTATHISRDTFTLKCLHLHISGGDSMLTAEQIKEMKLKQDQQEQNPKRL